VAATKEEAKNALGRGGASSRHIAKLEQSTFSLDIYDFIYKELKLKVTIHFVLSHFYHKRDLKKLKVCLH
jgi:hypothetical protein